jgi:LytS/YehU family sensor histidine kinase
VALQLSREWFKQRELIQKIEVEKLNTELDYLKAQLNPHFLFNSINTIYFQIDKENKGARETLSIFSDMLRYQLYECNGKEIPLEKEMNYLKNYIDLQRQRCNENYWISFSYDDVDELHIAPLLLIPFVENAFKHVSHFPQDNEIRVNVHKSGSTLRMMVFNTCDPALMAQKNGHGIGLKNVQRRLELLYQNRYSLEVNRSAQSYQVNLEIILSES